MTGLGGRFDRNTQFTRKDRFDDILKANMDADFSLFACGENAPCERDLQSFEQKYATTLPKDFRKFSMSKLGGIYIEVKESVWPRAKAYDVAPFWSFLYGLFAYGFGKGIPDWMDIRIQTEKCRAEMGVNVVPCLKIMGDADIYCFDESGTLKRWEHETGSLKDVVESFTETFAHEVAELKQRKERKKAEQSPPPYGSPAAGSPSGEA